MATNLKTRTNDHWSLRLRIKRPSRTSRIVLLVLALVQTVLLFLTASTSESGSLYGCASPCGTVALPTTPFLAVLMGIAIFVLPAVIGALCDTWPGALTLATLPWWLAAIASSGSLLASPALFVPATKGHPAASHFTAPFWLDAAHLVPLLLSLLLFAALGGLGWLAGQTLRES